MDAPVDDAPPPTPAPAPGRPPAPPGAIGFFLVVFLLLPAGMLAQAMSRAAGLLWSELFVFLLPALIAAAGSSASPRRWLGLGRTAPALLLLGALAGASATLVFVALQAVIVRLLPPAWLDAFDVAELFRGPPWERWALAATATFVAPVCEEIAFRGHLLRALRLRHGAAGALALSSVLFALVHVDPVRFVGLAGLGALFGWLALRGGSIWPAMAAHAGNNAVVSWVLVTGDAGASVDAAAAVPPPAVQLLAASGLGLVVLLPVLEAFRRAAAALPPAPDPAASATTFRFASVPRPHRVAAALGVISLAALAAYRAAVG